MTSSHREEETRERADEMITERIDGADEHQKYLLYLISLKSTQMLLLNSLME